MKAGHEVWVLCSREENQLPEEIVQGIKVIRITLPKDLARRALGLLWFRLLAVDPFWGKPLNRTVEREGIEAIHVHDLPMVKTAWRVARRFGIPVVADLHENYPEAVKVWGRNMRQKLVLGSVGFWTRLETLSVRQADTVLTVVDEAKEHYVRDCGVPSEKVIVLMNTEDPDYFCSLDIDHEIVRRYQPYFAILYVGGFGPHRGIQTAISAMPMILTEVNRARLVLVGSGSNEAHLKELAKDKGVLDAVDFTGQEPFSLVPSYIAASDVCIVPHIASGHTDTTIPHKLFQAMAMAKPVVVSSARPLERIVRQTGAGMVYPSGNADAFAEAVIRLCRDNDLTRRLGEAGRKAVESKYNWEVEGQKLVALYRNLH